ncbi:MAG: glycosyltransferase [Syntrophorhabdales bacterium]
MQKSLPKTCITIPCYNEANRLPFSELVEDLSRGKWMYLCFVDDGSTDNTLELLGVIKKQFPDRVLIIPLAQNRGKAEAVRTGILSSLQTFSPEFVGFFDADLATPLAEVERFLEIADRCTAIKMFSGCRFARLGAEINRFWWRHYLGRIFATAASISLGLPVYDTQCGVKVFRSEEAAYLFREPFLSRWFFDVEIFARMIRRCGKNQAAKQIMEIPLETWKGRSGSKVKFRTYLLAFVDLLRIHFLYHRDHKREKDCQSP